MLFDLYLDPLTGYCIQDTWFFSFILYVFHLYCSAILIAYHIVQGIVRGLSENIKIEQIIDYIIA
jgi:hypothetical protein